MIIVIDGAIRDRSELEQLNFPVFAKGFVPNGPYKDGPGNWNKPISCGGVHVNPGDLIVGDADGVTVVPRHQIDDVLEKAEKRKEYEEKRLKQIKDYVSKKRNGIDPGSIDPDLWSNHLIE